jgi:hypothetical protein
MGYDNSSRTAMILPAETITRFLDDLSDETYAGFGYGGFMWQRLIDPVERRYLQADSEAGGVQITAVLTRLQDILPLQAHDVLVSLDGYPIDAMGYYQDPDMGRILFMYLIQSRVPGDDLPAEIIREGRRISVKLPISRFNDYDALIPEAICDDEQDYLIEAGFVFLELNGRWLRAHGKGNNWITRVDPRIANRYITSRFNPENPGDRIVILTVVLPHDINIGYQQIRNQIVTAVNGQPIRNLNDIFTIKEKDGFIWSVRVIDSDVEMVLDKEAIAIANEEIRQQYNLSALRQQRFPGNPPQH